MQLELVKNVFISPKETFKALPSDKLFLLAWLAPFYFGIARIYRPGTYEKALSAVGNEYLLFILGSIFALVMIPLSALIVKLLIRIFGKKLTIKKLMNIYGYALIPRIVVAIFAYAVIFVNPNLLQEQGMNPLGITIAVAGVGAMLYTIFLYIYGIVVSPSEVKAHNTYEPPGCQ